MKCLYSQASIYILVVIFVINELLLKYSNTVSALGHKSRQSQNVCMYIDTSVITIHYLQLFASEIKQRNYYVHIFPLK